MSNKTTEKVGKIINTLKDEDVIEEVNATAIVDPTMDMKNNIMVFFNSRIKAIQSQEDLKILVQDKLTEKLGTEELTIAQLKDLFVVLSRETINASQDIMAMVQPSEAFNKPASESVLDRLSGEEQRKIDILYRLVEKGKLDLET